MSRGELSDHIEQVTMFMNGMIKERAVAIYGTVVPQVEVRSEPMETRDILRLREYLAYLHNELKNRT